MKNIFRIVILTLFCINCKAQQITTIAPLNNLNQDIQNGTYIKDINNVYLPYVGTWKGILNGKEHTYVFQIFTQHMFTNPSGTYYYEDILKAKYEVKDITSGNILFTTMSAVNYEDFYITALGTPDNGRLDFYFADVSNCYNSLKFALINVAGVSNQLRFGGPFYNDFYIPEGCPYADRYDIPVPIPKNVVLIKQ